MIHVIDRTLVPPADNVVDMLDKLTKSGKGEDLTTLVGLILAYPDVSEALSTADGITVFAPTNDAFAAIADVIPTLSDDQIIDILQYHVAGAIQFRENLQEGQDIIMLNNETLTVSAIIDDLITLEDQSGGEDAIVEEVNIQGGNGVVHVIDKVLLPF